MSDSYNNNQSYSTPGYASGLNPLGIIDRLNLTIHIRRYLKIVFQRWLILLACTVAGLSYQGYKAYNASDIFQAESRMKIAPKVSYRTGGEAEILESGMSFYEDQIEYMRSGDVLSGAEKKMQDWKPASGITPRITERIAQKGQGSTINMYVRSTDLDYAQRYAKAWVEAFEEFLEKRNRLLIGNQQSHVETQYAEARRELDRKQKELEDFVAKNDLSAIHDVYSKDRTKVERDLTQVRASIDSLEKQTLEEFASTQSQSLGFGSYEDPSASSQNVDSSARVASSKFDEQETSRYNALSLEIKRAREELNIADQVVYPNHPYYVKIKEEIEKNLLTQKHLLDIAADKRKSQIEYFKSQEANLVDQVGRLTQQINQSIRVKIDHDRLVSQAEYLKGRAQNYEHAIQSIQAVEEKDNKFEVLRKGEPTSLSPVLPNRKKMVFMGFAGGLVLGLAIIYLLHRLDDRMELAEDIEEELEEPILGQIPQLDTALFKESKILVTSLDPHNVYSEAIRGIRSAIMFGSHQEKKQVLAVTSAIPGDGKTSFTVNFAITVARANTRTLLIDCDLRRGNVERYFNGSPSDPGISEVLSGQLHWTDVLQKTDTSTLDFISTGVVTQAPSELLISPIMSQFLEQAKTTYDHIIFDSPPLTGIDDSFSLIRLVDGFLFVVKAGHTPMRFAKNALESIKQREANILGVVLNGVLPDNPAYYYTYYYHDYYKDQGRMELSKTPTADFKTAMNMPEPRKRTHSPTATGSGQLEDPARHQRRKPNPSMSLVEQTLHLNSEQVAEFEKKKAEAFKKRRAMAKMGQQPRDPTGSPRPVAPGTRPPTGTRPAGAPPGTRPPTGTRPAGAPPGTRPPTGTRPAGAPPGTRPPTGTRPAGAPPGTRPPTGTRPAGAPPGTRPPTGTRPAGAPPGTRPPTGTRPAGAPPGTRPPTGTRPAGAPPGTRPPTGTRPTAPAANGIPHSDHSGPAKPKTPTQSSPPVRSNEPARAPQPRADVESPAVKKD